MSFPASKPNSVAFTPGIQVEDKTISDGEQQSLRNMVGADSVRVIQSPSTGSHCVINLPETIVPYADHYSGYWDEDWYQGPIQSLTLLHGPEPPESKTFQNFSINDTKRSRAHVSALGQCDIITFFYGEPSKVFHKYEGSAYLLRDQPDDDHHSMIAVTRRDPSIHRVNIEEAHCHPITKEEASRFGSRMARSFS
jgi:hypothetical protein